MMRLRNLLPALVVVFWASAGAAAQEPIRFPRTPDISPDGKLVAFGYLGDIYVVETIGGVARPVTQHQAHELYPVFSPDGTRIAFSSNRHGSYDVFVVNAKGGRPTRLTVDSAQDYVSGWSPDGKNILFASSRSTSFPFNYELYTVPVAGGRVRRISQEGGKEGVYSPKGDQIAYVRGPGTWYRKGYRGSSNDDIWICNADGAGNRRITTFNGQDTSPMWSPDGQTLYYVSEFWGTPANIVRQSLDGKAKPSLLTFHKEESVRRARISGNGEWIVYECGADLWVVSTHEGSQPRKLAIEVHADDKVNPERTETFTRGATEFAAAPNEQHIAFVIRGELFLIPRTGGKATRLTDDPAYDHGLAWSPDNKRIVFLSDRNGLHEDFYLLESDPPNQRLGNAHRFKVKQLTNTPEAKIGAAFSPDGTRVGYISAGKLWTMKPDGTDQKIICNQTQVEDYDWSPDSKWIAFARVDGSFSTETYVIPAQGGEARNVTRYATYNADITWSASGMKLSFISNRRNSSGLFVMALQKPAVKGAPDNKEIDWEDVHLRVQRPAAINANHGAISPDGTRVAMRSFGSNGNDLWIAGVDGKSLNRVTTGNVAPRGIRWSKDSSKLYFLDRFGTIHVVIGGTVSAPVPFQARMTIRRAEEFSEMFEQSWRGLRDHFYDEKLHGTDWNAIRAKYRPLIKHVAMKEDLYSLIDLMLGELNASHLGIFGFTAFPEETTADLGVLFDPDYRGDGLKVAEILKRGPADQRGLALKKGDYILSIDGIRLTEQVNLSKLLNDKAGEAVVLEVAGTPNPDAKNTRAVRKVELTASARSRVSELMYERWVDSNAKRVAKLSKGRLGYIHIPNMVEDGMDRFVRSLYSDNFDKDGIVLDVRFNGGGFTHDQILNYLGGKEHTIFQQRNGGQGLVLRSYDRKWTRPLVLLVNNRSYSDAEIFPSAFRALGLGKLVGEPTGGYVIGTVEISLIDGSTFRLPQTGVYTYRKVGQEVRKVNMEKEGVVPDFLVEPHPDQLTRGEDPQLDKAIEVLQADVVVWQKQREELLKVVAGQKGSATPDPSHKTAVGPKK